jgi:hypothetical protein
VTTARSRQTQQARPRNAGLRWLLYLLAAGLLVASGAIHLHFWVIAYQHVKVLDVLFLVQVAAAFVAAVAVLVTRHLLVVLAAALLMAGTIVGFILVRTTGLFGFHLTFTSGEAYTVLVIEAAAIILLSVTAAASLRDRS